MFYTVDIEFGTRTLGEDQACRLMDELVDVHPSVGLSERDLAFATISVPAESVRQAAIIANDVGERAARNVGIRAPIIHLDVMTEAESSARSGFPVVPDLVSTAEAAELLGVSRQRVLQLVASGDLHSTRIGERTVVLERSAVEAYELARKMARQRAHELAPLAAEDGGEDDEDR